MSNCQDCKAAEAGRWHAYKTGCQSCQARMLATGEEARKSQATGVMTDAYRSWLQRVFGENWREGHEEVRRWDSIMSEWSAS